MYSFEQHIHNFSVWTAARASQRGFTSTKNIKAAIEKSELRDFVINATDDITEHEFATFHKRCANQMIDEFKTIGIENVTYGRAAKIISIYLKTSILLTKNGQGKLCDIIHPPIDNILLSNLVSKMHLKELKNLRWTHLKETEYWNLVSLLQSKFALFNWTLEEFWTPEQDN